MGSDELAVVDAECRLIGMQGLRIVDSSIMPSIVSGNLNAPTVMWPKRRRTLFVVEHRCRLGCASLYCKKYQREQR